VTDNGIKNDRSHVLQTSVRPAVEKLPQYITNYWPIQRRGKGGGAIQRQIPHPRTQGKEMKGKK